MRVFLDTNVVLDFLTGREPFADAAEAVVVQLSEALAWQAEAIVTRDVRGFRASSIPVCSPSEFAERFLQSH